MLQCPEGSIFYVPPLFTASMKYLVLLSPDVKVHYMILSCYFYNSVTQNKLISYFQLIIMLSSCVMHNLIVNVTNHPGIRCNKNNWEIIQIFWTYCDWWLKYHDLSRSHHQADWSDDLLLTDGLAITLREEPEEGNSDTSFQGATTRRSGKDRVGFLVTSSPIHQSGIGHQISRPDDATWIGRDTVAINHSKSRRFQLFLVFVIVWPYVKINTPIIVSMMTCLNEVNEWYVDIQMTKSMHLSFYFSTS